jgi:hypothetical protein
MPAESTDDSREESAVVQQPLNICPRIPLLRRMVENQAQRASATPRGGQADGLAFPLSLGVFRMGFGTLRLNRSAVG